jgi:hypothetical protein
MLAKQLSDTLVYSWVGGWVTFENSGAGENPANEEAF